VATEFYGTVLGFEQAVNADGPMDYPGVDLASFARNAGFDDGRVKHRLARSGPHSRGDHSVSLQVLYWIDPWGVQWEMEQGRPVGRVVNGIVG